ncbi:hypothetical protein ACWGI8_01000 [Streptomyces sp. NPDC054841]
MTHAPFTFHTRTDAYLAALRNHRPGTPVPVLGEPGPAHQAVIELSRPQPQRAAPDPGEILVVWPAGSKAAELAAALAEAVQGRGRELARPEDIGATSGTARHVLVVSLADEMDERSLTRMHDSLWEHRSAGEGGHLGMVVGADLEQLSWIVAKGLALPHRITPTEQHLRVWPAVQRISKRYGTGTWVLQDDAKAEVVRPLLLDTHTAAVSLVAHGRDDVIHLNDTVICPIGAHTIDPGSPSASHAPVCAFTGRCYRPEVANENIILSGGIAADVLFANSCMGMRVNEGLYPQEYLMPHGFVRGTAAAYLATGQVINGLLKVNDIFHTACGTGRTLGEAATLINDHLRYERVDLPYYTLLGLPWLTVAEGGAEGGAEPGAQWGEFLLAQGEPGVEGGGVRAAAVALAAEESTGSSAHVLYVSGRGAAVLGDEAPEGLDLSAVPHLKQTLQAMGRAMTNLEDVAFTGLKYSRQGNMLVNVRDQVASLSQALHGAALMGDIKRIRRRIGAITTGVERAELTLAEALFERGVHSFQHYNDVWGETLELHSPELSDEECPYCARLLVRQGATHPIIGRIGRDAQVCPRCGMIRDADARTPVAGMVVDTPEIWRCGETQDIALRFRLAPVAGEGAGPDKVAVGIFMANAAKNGMDFPSPRFVELGADGTGELRVSVEVPEGARMHQEYVRGLVVAEGTISFVTRPVWVRPAVAGPVPITLSARS